MIFTITLTSIYKICKRFLILSKGVVLIEAALVIFGTAMALFLVTDFGRAFLIQGRLEQATYSIASIARERTVLYGSRDQFTNADYQALLLLARHVMGRDDVNLQVDALVFVREGEKAVLDDDNSSYFPAPNTIQGCKTELGSKEGLYEISPESNLPRWMPIYRITLCIPGEFSLFQNLISKDGLANVLVVNEYISSNVVVSR